MRFMVLVAVGASVLFGASPVMAAPGLNPPSIQAEGKSLGSAGAVVPLNSPWKLTWDKDTDMPDFTEIMTSIDGGATWYKGKKTKLGWQVDLPAVTKPGIRNLVIRAKSKNGKSVHYSNLAGIIQFRN